jgi:hypothetical protein
MAPHQVLFLSFEWFYLGLSENRVYSQTNSHLIGIMISKTIGFRGLAYFQTHPFVDFYDLSTTAWTPEISD